MGTGRSGADDTTWVAVAAALSVAAVGETLVRLAGPSVTDPYLYSYACSVWPPRRRWRCATRAPRPCR
ncbi:hypothetical protein ACFQX7_30715 [Luedemannella flava]